MLSRRSLLATLLSVGGLRLVARCERSPESRDTEALALLDQIAEDLLRRFPETATSLGVDTDSRAALRSRLADRSAEGVQRVAHHVRGALERLDSLSTADCSHPVRTSVAVVRSAYTTALEGFTLPYGDITVGGWRNTPYVVIQNVGAYLDVPRFLDSDHLIENAADAEAYLARLASYARQLDGELARLQMARAIGLVPPVFLLDKALGQLKLSARNARAGAGSLVDSIARRTPNIPGPWADRARRIAAQQVAPALERQIEELETARGLATNDAGIWSRPHGQDFYRWALKASTTTALSPDELHQLGRAELEQLHRRMDAILKQLGYTQHSVGERMRALARDPRYKFPGGDTGRAEILAFITERLDWIRQQMPRAFHRLVNPNLEVRRLPPEEEPGAPAAYGGPGSIDGRIPGRFWINLRTTELHSHISLADLTFHEAIPGHIWQGEYTRQMPLIRQMLGFNAYTEGWALYAEQLADELGAYDDDPVGRLGYLQSIAFRACRLVVDTGIHAKQWTRDQGVRFFVEVNGSNPLEVASEVDRYCSWPGQACGYKVGHSEMVRQREKAMATLRSSFDPKAFNDTVVLGGDVPLDVLATNVDAYIGSIAN
jgi:uncharacterized protein (DUF885 family)